MESTCKITFIPKRTLIDTILNAVNHDLVRQHFNIDEQTNLHNRLESFKKTDLVELLSSTPSWLLILDAVSEEINFRTIAASKR